MTDTNIGNVDATEATTESNTQAEKTYSQREVDDMMARTKSAITKKVLSKYEDLGDPDTVRDIIAQHSKREQDLALKRGEFDKILQEMAAKKDAEIQKRDRVIEEFKLNSPIIDAAAKLRAVNPNQVKSLIRNNLRLNVDGEPEVLDNEGKVRYDDAGRPLSVESFVGEWLHSNPHFVQPSPSTSATKSSVAASMDKLDINKLDMRNPEHRKIYADAAKKGIL